MSRGDALYQSYKNYQQHHSGDTYPKDPKIGTPLKLNWKQYCGLMWTDKNIVDIMWTDKNIKKKNVF